MTPWTDERVELLKKLWSEGKSATQIRDALRDTTRNAVIGKVHRLKLESRYVKPEAVPQPPQPSKLSRISAGIFNGAILPAKIQRPKRKKIARGPIMSNPISIFEIKDGPYQCRWPLSEEVSPIEEFRYCGAPVMPSNPPPGISACHYCKAHYRRSVSKYAAVEIDQAA